MPTHVVLLLVSFGKSHPVSVIVFSRCHFTNSIQTCADIAIMLGYLYIAMPTHVVLLLVSFGKSRPVSVIVFSRCHFTDSIQTCAAIAITLGYLYIAMPTHVVFLHHFREMLLWVLIHGCMYSYLLLLLLLHYGRISIEEC